MDSIFNSDLMLDLETVGTKPGCGILSIGACTFNTVYKFYVKIDIGTCYDVGLKNDSGTLLWWKRQSTEAYIEAFSGTTPLIEALNQFSEFYTACAGKSIWSNGATFDAPILAAAYEACGMDIPWSFRDEKCYRTLKGLLPEIVADDFIGIKHSALADAAHQAKHAAKLLGIIASQQATSAAIVRG